MMGMTPMLGRGFSAEEEKPGNNVVILTYPFWVTHFHSSDSAIGGKLTFNDRVYTIIGVLPKRFNYAYDPPVLLPLALDAGTGLPGSNFLTVIGRMRPGVGVAQARNLAATALPQVNDLSSRKSLGTSIVPLQESYIGDSRPLLLSLMGFVIFVLLIACANTANLLLVRAVSREKEIAVRASLGAKRIRLVRQMLTESTLLALVSGVLGLLLAWWSIDFVAALLADHLPKAIRISIDGYVLAFALLISVITGGLFGLIPALQISTGNLQQQLREVDRATGSGARNFLRNGLVVAEIAFSLVLLAGAGLLLRSFVRITGVNKGFDSDHVLTMQITPPAAKFSDPQQELAYLRQILERVRVLPGVRSAGFVTELPLGGSDINGSFKIENRAEDPNSLPHASKRFVAGQYFESLHIPLIKVRYLTDSDTTQRPAVIVVNETLARQYFPGEDPIGKTIDVQWGTPGWSEIVGVVGDVKDVSLAGAARPTYYAPVMQKPELVKNLPECLVIRSQIVPAMVIQPIREQVRQLNAEQVIKKVLTMEQVVDDSLSERRAPMWLFGAFSVMALFLAAIGIYGVLSYYVIQRLPEIGVRMALGANRADVFKLIMGHAVKLVVIGVIVGVGAAMASARALHSFLFGINGSDPLTLAGVSLLLTVLALAACGVPALRAANLDPLKVLRNE